MHSSSLSSSLRHIYRASLKPRGCFRKAGTLACITHPLRAVHAPRTGKARSNSVNTAQLADFQPLTIEDYHVLIEAGRLDDRRVELLNGFLTRTHAQSVEHRDTTSFLYSTLLRALGIENRAAVYQSMPVSLFKKNSEPQPDVFIASGSREDYEGREIVSSDVLLIAEVSNSTIAKDSTVKFSDYASESIPEYWIVDIQKRTVQVHRKPEGNSYESKETFSDGFIAPVAFPDVRIRVKDLFRT